MNDERQQMLERIAEDESLVGDLAGDAAERLRQWANDAACTVAQRTDLDDETVRQHIKAIRAIARNAAAQGGDIAMAQQALQALPLSAVPATPDTPAVTLSTPIPPADRPAPPPSLMLRVRTWWRGLWSHVSKDA